MGLQTLVDFLKKKGFAEVEANPNASLSDEQYAVVQAEFSKDLDKGLRNQAQQLTAVRKNKEKKETIVLTESGEALPLTEVKKPKFVGHINLDSKRNPVVETVATPEPPVAEPEPKEVAPTEPITEIKKQEVAEEVPATALAAKEKPSAETPAASTERFSEQQPEEPASPKKKGVELEEVDGVYRVKGPTEPPLTLNIKGHIDLDSLNQSTRPPRTKKRKKGGPDGKRKGERVDINAEAAKQHQSSNNQQKGNNNNNNKGNKQHQNNQQAQGGKNRRKKNQPKEPVAIVEQSDEEVAKQVRETLARLTSGKNKVLGKGAKYRREKRDNIRAGMEAELEQMEQEAKILKLTEFVTANELASMMNVPVTQVIGTCMSLGVMVSINQRMDKETIDLVADEFGFQTEYVSADVSEAVHEEADDESDLVARAPIVTVMGHVDHGKTSLLDYIRKTNVIAGEAGGITQHIGAYNVKLDDGRHITFLDTPGHEAFTAMRARGAQVTDIAIIIIAADDDIMPQTKEAINHAVAAGVPIVFAINKIDKPAANPEKIKEHLAQMNFLVEDWGGK